MDFNATVSDDFLAAAGVPKGGRKVITVDERGEVISNLDGSAYEVGAGGSLSNSLVALARLGRAEAQLFGSEPLQVRPSCRRPPPASAPTCSPAAALPAHRADLVTKNDRRRATETASSLSPESSSQLQRDKHFFPADRQSTRAWWQ